MYVGRPSRWGNPWVVDPARATTPATNNARATPAECVRLFRDWAELTSPPGWIDAVRAELTGRDLACWCPLAQPCHADVLLELANPKEGN